jgi:(p)ppGpp synthase/HD superfamily hydrolase
MTNTAPPPFTRLARAFALACELHGLQLRKSTDIPYITHLMAVASQVGEHGGDEEQMIAALLHDGPEDQGGEAVLERIRAEFGDRVAGIVAACTDTYEEPKPPWRARKEAFLARIRHESPKMKLVCAADKLHNTLAIIRDVRLHGPEVWDRFKGGHEGTVWYHLAVADALADG